MTEQVWHGQCTYELQTLAGFVIRTRFRSEVIRECIDQILMNHGRPDLVEREHDWTHLAASYLEDVGFQPHEAAEAVRVIGCPSSVIDLVIASQEYGDPSRREWWVRDRLQDLKREKHAAEHRWVPGKGKTEGHWKPNGVTYLTEHQVRRQHEARERDRKQPKTEPMPTRTESTGSYGDALAELMGEA